ncbi:HEPN domain protein [Desulfobacca acetoxidans DSM 11109]|uniref:HEPN domain protein n=1 Tax=Desulfobacca acetoxidans (strain ATCC 700848 / DSM 11109 / ASRB2) TaxID=880072 RepID=F2NG30_DESAR|nr:HEPN domain protein [Desulfobacca acetoxidans DSM 11109]
MQAVRELIQAYLEKARKKLEVAKKLLDLGEFEDSVSRAYYAVFHAAQALLLSEGQKAESHKGVITLFSLLFVKTGKMDKKFGKYLTDLKDNRETCDYELFAYAEAESSQRALQEAEAFVTETEIYLTDVLEGGVGVEGTKTQE